ncbi:MAG: dTDP-4-dehydrorhamnose reductase [Butyricicoccus sp.]
MKKVWIVGASGHVGSALLKLLDCRKYELLVTDSKEVDVTNREDVHTQMKIVRPDVIINCAGMTDVAACAKDPDAAYRVNAIGARNLAMEAEMQQSKLIQISTDDVFDQSASTPYNEFDPVSPTTVYGKSKYAGERMITSLSSRFVIIRSSWVYGTGRDFVSMVLDALESGKPSLEVPVNQTSSPTSAKELACVITQFIDNDLYGVYHAVCTGSCNRYEYAREILRLTGNEHNLELIPIEEKSGVRPSYSVLDNMMLRLDGLKEPLDWKAALAEYLRETGGRTNG